MSFFPVIVDTGPLGCLVAAQRTKILHPFMNCSFVLGKKHPFKLPYGHIAHRGTSPLHERLFCVGKDPSLKLPYIHIAHKGTSPLHELLFCVL